MVTPEKCAICIETPRLWLMAQTLEHIEAELQGPSALEQALGAALSPAWPPGEYDRDALLFFHARLKEASPADAGWFGYYAIAKGPLFPVPTVIGSGGFTGPPDTDGRVEIGYSLVPEARGHGLATEMVQSLINHAFKRGATSLIAHTTPENRASIGVLLRCGFQEDGAGDEDGSVRYIIFPHPNQNHREAP